MTTLADFFKSEAKALNKQWPDLKLDDEQAKAVVRYFANRYTGRQNFHDLIMNTPQEE